MEENPLTFVTLETLERGNAMGETDLHRMRTSPCSSRRPRSVLLVSLYGFAAAEGGFKGMKPWEEEHQRKNRRERSWSARRRA